MMKKRNRWITTACLILTLLLIAGCAGSTNAPANAGQTTPEATNAAAESTGNNATDAATQSEYAEPVHFTVANLVDDTIDFTNDRLYEEYSTKFNFTWDVLAMNWDNWGEKSRLWINAGDMPDVLVWNFTFPEYVQYVDAGMLGALPQGWEAKYPNLADCQEKTGVKERITFNGVQYMLPRVTFYHFAPVDTILYHGSCLYRKDWLDKLGLEAWGDFATLDQMKDYLRGSIQNNPDNLPSGSVLGITDTFGLICRLFISMGDEGYNNFYKQDGKYIWGPTSQGTLDGIKLLRELYLEGLIDPDFYMITDKVHGDKFNAGTAAMFFDDMTVGGFASNVRKFGEANPDLGDPYDVVGLVNILGPDGKWHGTQDPNNWSSVVFSPKTDAATLERILTIFDYTSTLEQQEHIRMGFEGVDYEKIDKGDYKLLRPQGEDGRWPALSTIYPSSSILSAFTILGDDFSFADPAQPQQAKDIISSMYRAKVANSKLLPYDYDYVYFTSDAKKNYSSPINDEIVRIVVGSNDDIEGEWKKFIDSQMPIVQPLLDDLNTKLIQ